MLPSTQDMPQIGATVTIRDGRNIHNSMFGQTLISSRFLGGGWTNPAEKYARQIGSFPQVAPPRTYRCLNQSIWEHEDAAAEISLWFHLSILVGFLRDLNNPYIPGLHVILYNPTNWGELMLMWQDH